MFLASLVLVSDEFLEQTQLWAKLHPVTLLFFFLKAQLFLNLKNLYLSLTVLGGYHWDLKRTGRGYRGKGTKQTPSIYNKGLARLMFADATVDIGFCRHT